ncbi:MAG: hypothetical protein ACUVXC_18035, partial [Chloroflexus sp.]
MNDTIIATLRKLIITHGTDLCTDWKRLEALLRDYAGQYHREINVLVTVAKEGIARRILQVSGPQIDRLLYERLVSQLHDSSGLDRKFAAWAVASWAEALGKQIQTGPFVPRFAAVEARAVEPVAEVTTVLPQAQPVVPLSYEVGWLLWFWWILASILGLTVGG